MKPDIPAMRREHKIVTVDQARRMLFNRAWGATHGNQRLTAKLLGVHLRTVQRWIAEAR